MWCEWLGDSQLMEVTDESQMMDSQLMKDSDISLFSVSSLES